MWHMEHMYTENMSIIVVLFDIEKGYLTNRISVIKKGFFRHPALHSNFKGALNELIFLKLSYNSKIFMARSLA